MGPIGEVRSDRAKIDWSAARDEYVTGDETAKQLAERVGVSQRAVEEHAGDRERNGGRTWAEWRAEFRDEVSGQSTELVKRIRVQAAATAAMRHAELLQVLANESVETVRGALAQCEAKDRILLILKAIEIERKVHGLDKPVSRVEVTGKDGRAVEINPGANGRGYGMPDRRLTEWASASLKAMYGPDGQMLPPDQIICPPFPSIDPEPVGSEVGS
jgi:hypothetical protein